MSEQRHRRFLFLDPPKKAGDYPSTVAPPDQARTLDGVEPPAPSSTPARRARRRLLPVVPLAAVTVIVTIVAGSLVVELAVMPFVVKLPMPAGALLVALAVAILLVTAWGTWWLWRGRPVELPQTVESAPSADADANERDEPGSDLATTAVRAPRAVMGNHSGITIAGLVLAVVTCAPCAAIAPALFTGWLQSLALYPWYVQVTSTLFVASIVVLPVWGLWRVGRLWWRRYSAGGTRLSGDPH